MQKVPAAARAAGAHRSSTRQKSRIVVERCVGRLKQESIRAARPDGAPIYGILDNLSANKTPQSRAWAARNNVELCLTPTYASWANPIEAQFGPLRTS
ncbi:transposase [Actinomadura citrea]|uniref:Transposase n=1 Tax=Actinomadura citrea TaxID=46158 RepID=A0A7Y9GAW0_9ACTN|nr:transposase [Actinomadura citrea]NYE13154.1 transposase [Actinomadura citrea]GGU09828.1 hypothetical protein GCM10010177_80970 [Actinomadura citrea]